MFEQVKKYKAFVFAGLMIVLSPIIVYIIVFHDMKWGKPSDFADFATYFNNMLMPFLTFGTVVALVLTLKNQKKQLDEQREQFTLQIDEQRNQFQQQMTTSYFESYVLRFETQYERYLELCNREFPHGWKSSKISRFKLNELPYIATEDPKYKYTQEAIVLIEVLRTLDDKDVIDDTSRRIKKYTQQVKDLVESASHTLHATYSFSDRKNVLILLDLMEKAVDMIDDIHKWGIINPVEYDELFKLVEIPEKLRKFYD